jgi:hypothetical protein
MTTSEPIPSDRTDTGPTPIGGSAPRRMSTLSAVSLALALAAAVMTFYTTVAAGIMDLTADLLLAPVFFTVGLLATVLGLAVVATVLGVLGGIDATRAKLAGAPVGWAGAIIGILVAGFLLANLIRVVV